MSDFVKPVRKRVDVSAGFAKLVGKELIKDLHDDEAICPVCLGTGMCIEDNPYGLSDDPNKHLERFPYKHQSISFCKNCYNGVVHICPYCGEQMPRGRLVCSCETACKKQQEARDERIAAEHKLALSKAEKLEPDALGSKFDMCSSSWFPENEGYFSDWDEFFEAWHDNEEHHEIRPEYVWGTDPVDMAIDAYDSVERACEDLHEDAMCNISHESIVELQNFINVWIDRNSPGKTYYESHKYAVRIPWEKYDKEYRD